MSETLSSEWTPHLKQGSRVSAILISYNTAAMTKRAVSTLVAELDLEASLSSDRDEIIVVDNASEDGTAAMLRESFGGKGVRVIENTVNRGFGAANNVGMAAARGDWFLLINTDAFVDAGAIRRLIGSATEGRRRESCADAGTQAAGKKGGRVGVLGPKLKNEDGTLQRSCFRFPTPGLAWLENLGLGRLVRANRFGHDTASEVDFVSGACMLVCREVFEATGGFDEGFFMYSEETDWQRRIRGAGWSVWFEPGATVTHLGGGSQASGRVNPEFFRSLDRYVLKHHGRIGLMSFRLAMAVGAAVRLPVRGWLARRDATHASKLRVNRYVLRRLVWGDAAAVAAQDRGEA